MFNSLFKPQPLLPEEAVTWLFDGFAWALTNFGTDVFYNETILVEPSNTCFPGQGDSVDEMAKLIVNQVKHFAGLDYLPLRVINHHEFDQASAALPDMRQVISDMKQGGSSALPLFFEPQQIANPNAMIANYAHGLAHHLGMLAREPAPCDEAQWPHMMELLAVYMGFGVMFVNTAIPERISCGSCRNPAMDRKGALDEMEVIYALAIFCALKEIPAKQAASHIKSYLRPLLKKAIKDVQLRSAALARLKAIDSVAQLRGKQVTEQSQLAPPS